MLLDNSVSQVLKHPMIPNGFLGRSTYRFIPVGRRLLLTYTQSRQDNGNSEDNGLEQKKHEKINQ
jgi:hypothetical protein